MIWQAEHQSFLNVMLISMETQDVPHNFSDGLFPTNLEPIFLWPKKNTEVTWNKISVKITYKSFRINFKTMEDEIYEY